MDRVRFAASFVLPLAMTMALASPSAITTTAAAAATARLSWDPTQVVTDLPAGAAEPAPLYLLIDGAQSAVALGVDLRWTPSGLLGAGYSMVPDGAAASCGSTLALVPEGGLGSDSTFRWTITFPPGSAHDCVTYRIHAQRGFEVPATFCLVAVNMQTSTDEIVSLDVLGGATIMGGAAESCPLTVQSVWPDSIEGGSQVLLTVRGSAFQPGMDLGLAHSGTLVEATEVQVVNSSRLEATFDVPAGFGGAADVVVSQPGSTPVTLTGGLSITSPVAPAYATDHILAWFAPGRVSLPSMQVSALTSQVSFEPSSVNALLEGLGVVSMEYLTPASALAGPEAPPLFDRSQLDMYVLELADTNVIAACQALRADQANVRAADPDWYVEAAFEVIPNDSLFFKQWWLKNTGQFLGTVGKDAGISRAWGLSTGGAEPETVVVLDSGCLPDHPDLLGRVECGPVFCDGCTTGTGSQDIYGHATAVSGIIAAQGNGGGKVAGVNWTARLVEVRILNDKGTGLTKDGLNALDWARAAGYRFVNSSYGSYQHSAFGRVTCRNAYYSGMFIAASSGNDSLYVQWPAAYQPYVIAVGATDNRGERWRDKAIHWLEFVHPDSSLLKLRYASNFGWDLVLLAPGGRFIETTRLPSKGSYYFVEPDSGKVFFGPDSGKVKLGFGGTSASAPVVTGAASLIASYCPSYLSAEDLRELMCRTAIDIEDPGWDRYTGWGRLDVEAAMWAVRPGVSVVRDVAPSMTLVSQVPGPATTVLDWPGIPAGAYTTMEYTYRDTVPFAERYSDEVMAWARPKDSFGTDSIPEILKLTADTLSLRQWDRDARAYSPTDTSLVLETKIFRLHSAMLGDHWWPYSPSEVSVAYTLIGVPLSLLGADGAARGPVLALSCAPSIVRSRTTLRFELPHEGQASLRLFDVAGRLIEKLVDARFVAGAYRLDLSATSSTGRRIQPGVYFVRLDWGGETRTARLVVLR